MKGLGEPLFVSVRPQDRRKLELALIREAHRPDKMRDDAIYRVIRLIPRGKATSYSAVAAAAGFPLNHRLVAKLLRGCGNRLPWQRVVGADGTIRLRGEAALEQRTRLEFEGVSFQGRRVASGCMLSSKDLTCLRLKSRDDSF